MSLPCSPFRMMLLFVIAVSPTMANDDLGKLVDERLALRQRLQALREQIAEERRELLRGIDELSREVAIRQTRLDELVRQTATGNAELNAVRAKRRALQAKLKKRRAQALTVARSVRQDAARSVAMDREARLQQLDAAIEQLAAEDAAAHTGGHGALCELLAADLRVARRIALKSAPVTVGERRWPAFVVQVGLVEAYFVSEDRRIVGWADGDGWELIDEPATRKAITRLVAMLRGREPAALTSLPLRAPRQEGTP